MMFIIEFKVHCFKTIGLLVIYIFQRFFSVYGGYYEEPAIVHIQKNV